MEETVLEHDLDARLHEDTSREIPDTFEPGGTLSTNSSGGKQIQHSSQEGATTVSPNLAKDSTSQAWFDVEEQLRNLPQSTPNRQVLEISTQVLQRTVDSIDAALLDAPQSNPLTVEPFAQEQSHSIHQSSVEELPVEVLQESRSTRFQQVYQGPFEHSLPREIPSTTQPVRTLSQLRARQQSQPVSEDQSTIFEPSIETPWQPETQEGQPRSRESTTNQVSKRSGVQPETSSEEIHAHSAVLSSRAESSRELLSDSQSGFHDTVAPVVQVKDTFQPCQDIAKSTHANGDHSHLATLSQLPSQRQHGQSLPHNLVLGMHEPRPRAGEIRSARYSDIVDRLPRHDSSQESPGQSSVGSSPVPQPPNQSLGTLQSSGNAPRRPETLTNSFLSTVMNSNEHSSLRSDVPRASPGTSSTLGNPLVNEPPAANSGTSVQVPESTSEPLSWTARFQASRAKLKLEQDERERQRLESRRSEAREAGARAQSEAVEKIRSHDRLAAAEAGTRSPSTIPDRLPAPQEPTSLRAVATSSAAATSIPAPVLPVPQREEAATTEPEAAPSSVPIDFDMGEASYSDNDDEESLLLDDVELQDKEYIIPLPMHGRQADSYRNCSARFEDLYKSRAHHHETGQNEVEEILTELRCIETHLDLARVANSTPQPNDDPAAQDRFLGHWSESHSVKFKFLSQLLSRLEARDLHIILLIEDQENTRLFAIVESFLRNLDLRYECPSNEHSFSAANESKKERKRLKVTILASTDSRILREADLIVCLDGKPNVTKIRKKSWALKPDRSGVPFLHMIIPRTLGHIERYLSTKLDRMRRLDTIMATLSQFMKQDTVGRTDDASPNVDDVVTFLLPSQDESALSEWPLPLLGTIKDDIEYLSQQSQDALRTTVPLPGPNAIGKRPLIQNDDRDDPAKRMRFTPQPQPKASTSHVSDSEPATSLSIEQQLEWYKQDYKRLQAVNQSFVNRQWQYEEMSHKYKAMETRAERAENERDTEREQKLKLREQLTATIADSLEHRKNAEELRVVSLLSEDTKVQTIAKQDGEIERLKDELAKETKAKEDAIASKKSTETTLDYVNEQRRDAQDAASAATQTADKLLEVNAKLERAAKAKTIVPNINEQQKRRDEQALAAVTAERDNLKKQLRIQAEKNKTQAAELERFRTTRGVGGSTRAASVGAGARTPRPASRAASPLPNGRDRIANLRNG